MKKVLKKTKQGELTRWKLALKITGPKGVKKTLEMDDLYGKKVSIAKIYPIPKEKHALVVLKTRGSDDPETHPEIFYRQRVVLVDLSTNKKKSSSKKARKIVIQSSFKKPKAKKRVRPKRTKSKIKRLRLEKSNEKVKVNRLGL